MGVLPAVRPREYSTDLLDYAQGIGADATIYPDGHPSDDEAATQILGTDPTLLSFCSLGFLVRQGMIRTKKPGEKWDGK